jgi:hypothetical protein
LRLQFGFLHLNPKLAACKWAKTTKCGAKNDIATIGGLIEIGILLYPGAQMSAVLGLTDLFGVANRLSAEHGATNPRELGISHWQLRDKPSYELVRVFDTHQQQPQKLVGLILPPNLNTDPQGGAIPIPELQRWVETPGRAHCNGDAVHPRAAHVFIEITGCVRVRGITFACKSVSSDLIRFRHIPYLLRVSP